MLHVRERFYSCVDANSYSDQDHIPASGDTLTIREIGGGAGIYIESVVEIWWDKGGGDESLLFATHGDTIQKNLSLRIEGDGTKKVTIRLKNDSGSVLCLGGYYNGIEG